MPQDPLCPTTTTRPPDHPARAGRESVLVVGSLAYDNIVTPTLRGDRILGGSACYAAVAASFFAPTRLVGVVGNDFAEADRDRLKARGIDLEGLQTDLSGPTFFWVGRYYDNFNRRDTLDLQLNVFAKFRPELPANYRSSRYVLLGNIHPALQEHVLNQITHPTPFILADTIDFWIDTERAALLSLIRKVDLFVINDQESEKLTGQKNVYRAGRQILEDGPRALIIKKGEHGALLFHREGIFALPAFPVTEMQDPTGAGDSFAGALLGSLAAADRTDFAALREAMIYATVTASLTVEDFFCGRLEQGGLPEIEARAARLRAMIAV